MFASSYILQHFPGWSSSVPEHEVAYMESVGNNNAPHNECSLELVNTSNRLATAHATQHILLISSQFVHFFHDLKGSTVYIHNSTVLSVCVCFTFPCITE